MRAAPQPLLCAQDLKTSTPTRPPGGLLPRPGAQRRVRHAPGTGGLWVTLAWQGGAHGSQAGAAWCCPRSCPSPPLPLRHSLPEQPLRAERPGSRWGGFGPAERSGLRHPPPSPRPHPTPAALLVQESKMPGKFRLRPKRDPELRLGRGNTVAPLSTAAGLARVTQRTKQSRTAEGEQGSSHVRTRRDSRGCHSHQLVRGRQVEEPVMQRKHAVPSGFGMRLPLRLTGKGQTDWHRPQDKGPRAGRPAFT